MQYHGIGYDDVSNELEARERLFAAAKLAAMKRNNARAEKDFSGISPYSKFPCH